MSEFTECYALREAIFYGGLEFFFDSGRPDEENFSSLDIWQRYERWKLRSLTRRRPRTIRTILVCAAPLFKLPLGDSRGDVLSSFYARRRDGGRTEDRFFAWILSYWKKLSAWAEFDRHQFPLPSGRGAEGIESDVSRIMRAELAATSAYSNSGGEDMLAKFCAAYDLDRDQVWKEMTKPASSST